MKRKSQQLEDPPDICMRGQTGEAALCTEENTKRRSSEGTSSDPVLEVKHKIFLSHSGAQKEFVEQLCEALENRFHYPFFDKRPSSLPKGEKFPQLIIQAAKWRLWLYQRSISCPSGPWLSLMSLFKLKDKSQIRNYKFFLCFMGFW